MTIIYVLVYIANDIVDRVETYKSVYEADDIYYKKCKEILLSEDLIEEDKEYTQEELDSLMQDVDQCQASEFIRQFETELRE